MVTFQDMLYLFGKFWFHLKSVILKLLFILFDVRRDCIKYNL